MQKFYMKKTPFKHIILQSLNCIVLIIPTPSHAPLPAPLNFLQNRSGGGGGPHAPPPGPASALKKSASSHITTSQDKRGGHNAPPPSFSFVIYPRPLMVN